jgi:hypothetical protein
MFRKWRKISHVLLGAMRKRAVPPLKLALNIPEKWEIQGEDRPLRGCELALTKEDENGRSRRTKSNKRRR